MISTTIRSEHTAPRPLSCKLAHGRTLSRGLVYCFALFVVSTSSGGVILGFGSFSLRFLEASLLTADELNIVFNVGVAPPPRSLLLSLRQSPSLISSASCIHRFRFALAICSSPAPSPSPTLQLSLHLLRLTFSSGFQLLTFFTLLWSCLHDSVGPRAVATSGIALASLGNLLIALAVQARIRCCPSYPPRQSCPHSTRLYEPQ